MTTKPCECPRHSAGCFGEPGACARPATVRVFDELGGLFHSVCRECWFTDEWLHITARLDEWDGQDLSADKK